MVTQKHIAEKLGISQSAVACAFHPTLCRNISTRKRQRVAAAAARLGYIPNQAARRLARARSERRSANFEQIGFMYVIGNAVRGIDEAGVAMLNGAEDELSNADATLLFVRVNQRGWDKVNRLAGAGVVDGWLLSGEVDDEVVNRLRASGVPHVIVGEHRCTTSNHSVSVDHFATGRLAAQHLAELGHRRIAFFGGLLRYAYQTQTLKGFRVALRERGLTLDDRMVMKPGTPFQESFASGDARPTALFSAEPAGNNIRRMLNGWGIAVPAQVSILASEFAGSPTIVPDLTRIELPMESVGRRGAQLLQKVTAEPGASFNNLTIAPTLVEGGSTRRIDGRRVLKH